MDEVLKFLKENPTYFLATAEGDQPGCALSEPSHGSKENCISRPGMSNRYTSR